MTKSTVVSTPLYKQIHDKEMKKGKKKQTDRFHCSFACLKYEKIVFKFRFY